AIRDIYENDLRRSDHDVHQTRQSRTPHPPRTHTSHGPRGNEPHLHAHTQARAQFLRPVIPLEQVVTPVVPFSATRDQLSHPPSTWTSYPSSGIHSDPLLQPPDRRLLRPYRQRRHSSHTPAYHQAAEFNSVHPSHTPWHSVPPPLDEGIRINPEPMLSNHCPQRHLPFAHNTTGTREPPQRSAAPSPEAYTFRFPPSLLSHPHPYYPYLPGGMFRARNIIFGQESASARRRPARPRVTAPVQPLVPDLYTSAYLSGGWPLSGPFPWRPPWVPGVTPGLGSIPRWTPGTWPPLPWPTGAPVWLAPWLTPNPVNPSVPQIKWDVSTHPMTARRITGAHVILPLDSREGGSAGTGIDHELATLPPSDRIIVLCDVGSMSQFWGPVVIERPGGRVTIRDLLKGIYAFFQTRLTRAEVEHISSLGPNNYGLLVDAYQRRTTQRHLGVLRDWEWREGMRRVDCLGDRTWWWGVWVTYNSNGRWQLNLGLANPTHRST
ncbi:hypothetical protein BKA82DRAFT_2655150, partial [Pisolithus tinctorius]